MLPLRWTIAPPFATAARQMRQPGSLTAWLARRGQVTVTVLYSGWDRARPDEARGLGLRLGQRLYSREVCVRCDGVAAILARSVTTVEAAKGTWRGLHRLGRRPLADLLWTNPRIVRDQFEYCRLPATDSLLRAGDGRQSQPARRSTFRLHGEEIIVLEAFVGLPWPNAGWRSQQNVDNRI
jgi:chorismate--pyruvate lyase